MIYVCPCSKCLSKRKTIRDKAPEPFTVSVTNLRAQKSKTSEQGAKLGCFSSFESFKVHLAKEYDAHAEGEGGGKTADKCVARCPFGSCAAVLSESEKVNGFSGPRHPRNLVVEHILSQHMLNTCYLHVPRVSENKDLVDSSLDLQYNDLGLVPSNYKSIVDFIDSQLIFPCVKCSQLFHEKSFLTKHALTCSCS
jgi:hypothetical protein